MPVAVSTGRLGAAGRGSVWIIAVVYSTVGVGVGGGGGGQRRSLSTCLHPLYSYCSTKGHQDVLIMYGVMEGA